MEKALLYYSATGNTRWVCRQMQQADKGIGIFDITKVKPSVVSDFNVLGFACYTYDLSIPPYFKKVLERLPDGNGKHAFILATYGIMPGKSIRDARRILQDKGYNVLNTHSIQMPESSPYYRKKGIQNDEFPNDEGTESLRLFTKRISDTGKNTPYKAGFWNTMIPAPSVKKIKKDFSILKLDQSKCTSCKLCLEYCDYRAIKMNEQPELLPEHCRFCYSCMNNCPEGAISTDKIEADFRYQSRLSER